MGKDKPIWRLAFFSRLEERKGIKLFVDAISQLDVSHIPNFEVSLICIQAAVPQMPHVLGSPYITMVVILRGLCS